MPETELKMQLENAVGTHIEWRKQLRNAIDTGESETTPEQAACNTNCAIGKWLASSDINAVTNDGTPYRTINDMHTEFHICAGEILGMVASGKSKAAEDLLFGDFTVQSENLIRGLKKWRNTVA